MGGACASQPGLYLVTAAVLRLAPLSFVTCPFLSKGVRPSSFVFPQTRQYNPRTLGVPLSEADTCRTYVLPKLYAAGWTDEQIREQVTFTDGRIVPAGSGHVLMPIVSRRLP